MNQLIEDKSRDTALVAALASGGDSRQVVDPETLRNKYHCSYIPLPDVVPFGSCTASNISSRGFESAMDLYEKLRSIDKVDLYENAVEHYYSRIRHDIKYYMLGAKSALADVVLSPSGTDIEYVALNIALQRSSASSLCNILMGPLEIGSGSFYAAQGRYFDSLLPSGKQAKFKESLKINADACIRLESVPFRDADGKHKTVEELDQQVEALIKASLQANEKCLIHIVAHSKTGFHSPSIDLVKTYKEKYPDDIDVVVDAAQGRFSCRGIVDAIESGFMIILTGSKFFGGPSFCGALLVPSSMGAVNVGYPFDLHDFIGRYQVPVDWKTSDSGLGQKNNIGLLLRWQASLAEIREYYSVPPLARLEILRYFERVVPELFTQSGYIEMESTPQPVIPGDFYRLLQSKITVYSFYLRRCNSDDDYFHYEQLRNIWQWMSEDCSRFAKNDKQAELLCWQFMAGQPVKFTAGEHKDKSLLRIALGAVLISAIATDVQYGEGFAQRLAWLESSIALFRDKLDFIAENYDELEKGTDA